MSTLSFNASAPKREKSAFARLIPGELPASKVGIKKPPQSVKSLALAKTVPLRGRDSNPTGRSAFLMPAPLQRRNGLRWLRTVSADYFCVALSWSLIGYLFRSLQMPALGRQFLDGTTVNPFSLLGFAIPHAALVTMMSYTEGIPEPDLNFSEQRRILGKAILWSTTLLYCATAIQGSAKENALRFGGAGLLSFAFALAWRKWNGSRQKVRSIQSDARNVLVVGAGKVGRRVAEYIEHHPSTGRFFCGFLDDQRPVRDDVIGRVSDLAWIARKWFVDELILAGPMSGDVTQSVTEEACRLHLDVEVVPDLFGCRPVTHEVERIDEFPAFCIHAENPPAARLVLKRTVDILGSGVAMLVLSPLLVAISFLVKIDSPGPVLYSAERAGRKGVLFRCYKFRTMVQNADELKTELRRSNERSGPFFKIARDPRITRVGHYLRRYSLDELPQLWNVLKGEMSLVGPRPHPLDDVAEYEIEHLGRLDVTPGITGLWQITARRDPSFQRGVQLDREYIEQWSLGLDLEILVRTFKAVLCGSGE